LFGLIFFFYLNFLASSIYYLKIILQDKDIYILIYFFNSMSITGIPNLSIEQINSIKNYKNNNIIVDSVAGSGKTSLSLGIAREYSQDSILLLTFNKKLSDETADRIQKSNLKNIKTSTFHGFASETYNIDCSTDLGLIQIVEKNPKQIISTTFNRVILDEHQDATPLLYTFICKFLRDNIKCFICVLGDTFQCIYKFKNADSRFLTLADKLYGSFNPYPWKFNKLATTYRLTNESSNFINNCMLNEKRLISVKCGKKVNYKYYDCYKLGQIQNVIDTWLAFGSPSDIFILAPSLKSKGKSAIKLLENYLVKKRYHVYTPSNDEDKLDLDVIKNKIVFSSFHQSKGMQRKYVIVFNFDKSYFSFYNRYVDPNVCPNELYVAVSRAESELVLIHNSKFAPLDFLQTDLLDKHTLISSEIKDEIINKNYKEIEMKSQTNYSVTDLTSFISATVLFQFSDKINSRTSYDENKELKVEDFIIDVRHNKEMVSDITGVALPAFYQNYKQGKMYIDPTSQRKPDFSAIITVNMLLRKANEYLAKRSGFIGRLHQITKYDWLSKKDLSTCKKRLDFYLNDNVQDGTFEREIILEHNGFTISGSIDYIYKNEIWEFKCVNQLKDEHLLQLYLYGYMYYKETRNIPICKLINIKTGEMKTFDFSRKLGRTILETLLENKKQKENIILTDLEFLEKNLQQ